MPVLIESIADRVQALDWDAISESLWRDGCALTPTVLRPEECRELIETYDHNSLFRSQVVMARFGFGRGEYKYFKYPLPEPVQDLREEIYPRLAPLANRWAAEIGGEVFPEKYADFLGVCHAAGQDKPTPLILKYETGDFNCLHQDLYGAVAFPFQLTVFLSQRETDYSGGEFVLVEQRPRMQSRVMVITAQQGQAVIFPTRYRAVRGSRGFYKANLKHGVSPLCSGKRFTLGIIFHDAQ
ncbi:MAG: 2OG-Fe(II) oxygenase [Acidobacteriia bacterium]|nr:2OG-Fe(II) oxygenase [Terriglobia bacterium]